MLEKIVARIEELTKALESSAAHHNALVGSLEEAKKLYQMVMTCEKPVEDAIVVAEEVAQVVEAM